MSLGARTRDGDAWHNRLSDSIDLLGPIFVGTSTNSGNNYTVTPQINKQSAIGSLVDGERFCWIPNTTNNGASTLAVSPLIAAKSIKKQDGSTALDNGDLPSGVPVVVQYSSALDVYRLVAPLPGIWTSFVPTLTASGGMTFSAVNNRENRYRSVLGAWEFEITNDYTLATAAGVSIFIGVPFAISGHQANVGFICAADDGGAAAIAGGGRWRAEATPRIHLFKPGAPLWTLGVGASHSIQGSCKIG